MVTTPNHRTALDFSPFASFDEAARAVLSALNQSWPMGTWMMTRVEGDDWIVLQAEDQDYGVETGDVLRWQDSYCSRMVGGLGPHITDTPASIPVYREAPVNEQLDINGYIGVPVNTPDGELFGTLCAIDSTSVPVDEHAALPIIQAIARLLGTVLARERERDEKRRLAEWADTQMHTDSLTGLANRRAWMQAVDAEDTRAARYGDGVGIIMVDLDGLKRINDTQGHAAGDAVIRKTASVIARSAGERSLAARLGGDEFAVLIESANADMLDRCADAIRRSLDHEGVSASIGYAMRSSKSGCEAALDEADKAMYADKTRRYQSGVITDRRGRPM